MTSNSFYLIIITCFDNFFFLLNVGLNLKTSLSGLLFRESIENEVFPPLYSIKKKQPHEHHPVTVCGSQHCIHLMSYLNEALSFVVLYVPEL